MAASHGKRLIWLMTYENSSANNPQRRVYGRRQSRPLRKTQAEAIEKLLPVLSIDVDVPQASLDPTALFDKSFKTYALEIGFGKGEHLAALMGQFPKTAFMGVEPFINGMSSFLRDITALPHDNIRVLMDDAVLLAEALTDECLDKVYVLNPDPWPKTRHHKRRIINQQNLDHFTRILKHGGQLIMATDVDDLAEWMLSECMRHPSIEWTAQSAKDWQTPPAEWIETRYAFKGRTAGRRQTFLIFEKKLAHSSK